MIGGCHILKPALAHDQLLRRHHPVEQALVRSPVEKMRHVEDVEVLAAGGEEQHPSVRMFVGEQVMQAFLHPNPPDFLHPVGQVGHVEHDGTVRGVLQGQDQVIAAVVLEILDVAGAGVGLAGGPGMAARGMRGVRKVQHRDAGRAIRQGHVGERSGGFLLENQVTRMARTGSRHGRDRRVDAGRRQMTDQGHVPAAGRFSK